MGGGKGGAKKPLEKKKREEEKKVEYRTALMGILGTRLSGPAIGALLAKFVLWCDQEGFIPVLDFEGVEWVGQGVIEGAFFYHEDHCQEKTVHVLLLSPPGFSQSPPQEGGLLPFCDALYALAGDKGGEGEG